MKLGMPFYLIDRTGSLSGSDYVDMYQRLTLTIRCTASDASHTAYMIFDNSHQGRTSPKALAALDFGPHNSLGTVSFAPRTGGGPGIAMPMKKYLSKGSSLAGMARLSSCRFFGSDGKEYKWKRHAEEGQDWTCTVSATGEYIASYGTDPSGQSAQRVLTLEEDSGYLGPEILASLMIVRHIEVYRL